MQQAEIGRARVTDKHSFPARGHVMRDFTLPSTDCKQISLYDYRGHANLVLIFAGDVGQTPEKEFLPGLVQRYGEIRAQDTEVLLVLAGSRERAERTKHQAKLPFLVLVDEDMQIHKSVGALGAQAVPAVALYVTDRFRKCLPPGVQLKGTPCLAPLRSSPGSTTSIASAPSVRKRSCRRMIEESCLGRKTDAQAETCI